MNQGYFTRKFFEDMSSASLDGYESVDIDTTKDKKKPKKKKNTKTEEEECLCQKIF